VIVDCGNSNKLFSLNLPQETMNVASKPERRQESREATYDSERWSLLTLFRQNAVGLLEVLEQRHLCAIVHGSIARGDVNKDSDIDIFVPDPASSFQIETALEQAKINVATRTIIQATPAYAVKAYIEIDATITISFPLMSLRRTEREFYGFSGRADLSQLKIGSRVPGIDKRLMLIQPTEKGHVERSIIGREEQTAKMLGISVETVLDRVHALLKRDAVGRTGVFVKKELESDETFELALKRLSEENPAVRRKLKSLR
jgi:predicted nucleotidyltransferase